MTPHQTNVVLVGKKPPMNYILAAMRLFQEGASEVVVKARGMNICKAVDVAERLTGTFMKDVKVKQVSIGSDEIQDEQGRTRKVSTIEIVLAKEA
ncbi:MAG: DNA-binding protein Alba [Desulfurococcales archaeon]|nr:DNA-binding protein Alba [Desulfurococcales archaeon]